jgi:hypothetical protein
MNLEESLISRILLTLTAPSSNSLCCVSLYSHSLDAVLQSQSQSQSYVTTDGQSASLSWCQAPTWGVRPDFYYCQTVVGLLMWVALSDERTGLPVTIAAGPHHRSHSWVRVPRDSWPYFTVSDSRLPQSGGPDPGIYIPQEQGGPVIPPGTGLPFVAFYDSQGYGGGIRTRLHVAVFKLVSLYRCGTYLQKTRVMCQNAWCGPHIKHSVYCWNASVGVPTRSLTSQSNGALAAA